MSTFFHQALTLQSSKPLIYTAMSKHYFYLRTHVSKYVLQQGKVPLNPFLLFDYFLADSVDRDSVRSANNSIVLRVDQVWVFGPISNGVLAEIILARHSGKPIFYFKIENNATIVPILEDEVTMEEEILQHRSLLCSCVS